MQNVLAEIFFLYIIDLNKILFDFKAVFKFKILFKLNFFEVYSIKTSLIL